MRRYTLPRLPSPVDRHALSQRLHCATRARRTGFTLLEMLIVLVLLGTAAVVISLSTSRGLARAQQEKACRDTALLLRAARVHALATGRSQAVVVDVAQRALRDVRQQWHRLPESTRIEMEGAARDADTQRGAIAFAADGSSGGGHISLMTAGAARPLCRIDVSWLTGVVTTRDERTR